MHGVDTGIRELSPINRLRVAIRSQREPGQTPDGATGRRGIRRAAHVHRNEPSRGIVPGQEFHAMPATESHEHRLAAVEIAGEPPRLFLFSGLVVGGPQERPRVRVQAVEGKTRSAQRTASLVSPEPRPLRC